MLLYTVMPYEDVFGTESETAGRVRRVRRPVPGGYVELCEEKGEYTVSRLFSTDPRVYLRPELSPGQKFKPDVDTGPWQ